KGAALVQSLFAVTMVGALSIAVVRISSNTNDNTRREIANYEAINLKNTIASTLLSEKACTNTLGEGDLISNGLLLSSIKNKRGGEIVNLLDKYGNNQITVKKIEVNNILSNTTPSGDLAAKADVIITLNKAAKGYKGPREIRQVIPVNLKLNSSNELISCFSDEERAIVESMRETCEAYGGGFDETIKKCSLKSSYPSLVLPEDINNETAVSTMLLDSYNASVLDTMYLNTIGDTMVGKLESTTGFCINGKCRRTFEKQNCPSGKVASGINEDGTLQCVSLTCPSDELFYVGLKSDGTPDCKKFPENTCSEKQYVAKVRPDGSVSCRNLPPKKDNDCRSVNGNPGAIGAIDENGNETCVELPKRYGVFCPSGQVATGWKADGSLNCKTIPVLVAYTECYWSSVSFSSGGWASSSCGGEFTRTGANWMGTTGKGYLYNEFTLRTAKVRSSDGSSHVQARCCKLMGRLREVP
ncbi:hypothetical protein ABMA71_14805, partial [Halobacteriovorax sp. ZH3_bin.1]